jgi:hypothetical protein
MAKLDLRCYDGYDAIVKYRNKKVKYRKNFTTLVYDSYLNYDSIVIKIAIVKNMYRDLYRYKFARYKSRYIAKGGRGDARHQKPVCCCRK